MGNSSRVVRFDWQCQVRCLLIVRHFLSLSSHRMGERSRSRTTPNISKRRSEHERGLQIMEIKWGKKPTVDKTKQGYHRSQLSNHARVSQLPSALGPFPRHSGTRTTQKHSPPSPPPPFCICQQQHHHQQQSISHVSSIVDLSLSPELSHESSRHYIFLPCPRCYPVRLRRRHPWPPSPTHPQPTPTPRLQRQGHQCIEPRPHLRCSSWDGLLQSPSLRPHPWRCP